MSRDFSALRVTPPPPLQPPSQEETDRLSARKDEDRRHKNVYDQFNKDRVDQSFHLCHFTSNREPSDKKSIQTTLSRLGMHTVLPAYKRFEQILRTKHLLDCDLPHLPCDIRAVCFTEMIETALTRHAEVYSPWGVAFQKSFLFNTANANPVLYCRSELFEQFKTSARDNADMLRYLTPLIPKYDENQGQQARPLDYAHEREWRTPGPVPYSLNNLSYVTVPDADVFIEILPDLYQELTTAGVVIKEIPSLHAPDSCIHGYHCRFGLNCRYHHTDDQRAIFECRLQRRQQSSQPSAAACAATSRSSGASCSGCAGAPVSISSAARDAQARASS